MDNDGYLDLILNNIDTTAFIYRNTGGAKKQTYLRLSIAGAGQNTRGLGTKAWLYSSGQVQYAELTNARGFQSSSEPVLHFGTGTTAVVDSVVVVFPSQKYTTLRQVKTNQHFVLSEADAEGKQYRYAPNHTESQWLMDNTNSIVPLFVHQESDFNDFKRDKLIPRMFSKEGPALAVGDLNADGLDDFFVGGAAGQSGAVYFQQSNGRFKLSAQPALAATAACEDVAALIADLNADGQNDLYVVSGSNEFEPNDLRYKDRLYLNTGRGMLQHCADCLPALTGSKSCIAAHDVDADGDTDLFIGGRTVPHSYGKIPRAICC
ncbi:MAG: VCBS repeat-containing protein [Saprospiraceae bacterium]|nr:VCBS repeat-containing protein [Saprospiraceae bacterium]